MQRDSQSRIGWKVRAAILMLSIVLAARADDVTFQSKQAKDAQSQYDDKLHEIKAAAATQMAQAKKDYIVALTEAQKSAQLNDLDEAVRIRDAIQRLKDEEDEADRLAQEEAAKPRRSLESRLAGTKWYEDKPGYIWTFNRDGTLTTSDGREGKWAAISATVVLSVFTNGYVDRLEFDENLTTISDTHAKLGDPWKAKRAN